MTLIEQTGDAVVSSLLLQTLAMRVLCSPLNLRKFLSFISIFVSISDMD